MKRFLGTSSIKLVEMTQQTGRLLRPTAKFSQVIGVLILALACTLPLLWACASKSNIFAPVDSGQVDGDVAGTVEDVADVHTEFSQQDQDVIIQEGIADVKTDAPRDTGQDSNTADTTDVYVPPSTCRDQILDYQCLDDKDCPKNTTCAGVMPCGGKHCFGNCDVYPGTCIPKYKHVFCTSSSQCPQFYVCVGSHTCNGPGCLAPTIPGLCRYAGPGRCYKDSDCSNGKYCAQALYCQSGPCWGQDFPGKCVDKPKDTAKGCLDDRDCSNYKTCNNATLCTMFDSCATQAGTCEPEETCMKSRDCSNPEHSFCEDSFTCPSDKCVYQVAKGYCVHQPGPSACWSDKDCPSEWPFCKGARVCRPGSLCDTLKQARTGYCVKSLSPKGIKVIFPDKIVANQAFPVAIINYTGDTIGVRKTYTFFYMIDKNTSICPDPKNMQSCIPAGPVVPINDGGVFTRMEKVTEPGTYSLQFNVFPSSAQGVIITQSTTGVQKMFQYQTQALKVLSSAGK